MTDAAGNPDKKTTSEAQSTGRRSRGGLSVLRYAQIYAGLAHHRKLKALMRRLDLTRRDAIGLYTLLCLEAVEYSPDGDLSHYTCEEIAAVVDWPEKTAAGLVRALVESGFLDGDRGPGGRWRRLQIHDWDDWTGKARLELASRAEYMRIYRQRQSMTDPEIDHDDRAKTRSQNGSAAASTSAESKGYVNSRRPYVTLRGEERKRKDKRGEEKEKKADETAASPTSLPSVFISSPPSLKDADKGNDQNLGQDQDPDHNQNPNHLKRIAELTHALHERARVTASLPSVPSCIDRRAYGELEREFPPGVVAAVVAEMGPRLAEAENPMVFLRAGCKKFVHEGHARAPIGMVPMTESDLPPEAPHPPPRRHVKCVDCDTMIEVDEGHVGTVVCARHGR